MKRLFLILFALILLCGDYEAQPGETGLGIMIGSPAGISFKHWIDKDKAFDAGLGFSLINGSRFNLHADYLYHKFDQFESDENIPVYYGFGFRLLVKNNEYGRFGFRGVAGLNWFPKNQPIGVFFELAPVFELIPETALDFDAAIGVRYYFQ